ncbi:Peptidase C10 family protein [Prevotella aff. ruminicola Tc2-24]|jgi:hypothetical protein|uniref:Peptidase C10 family protein n=1 Tax=Prevotella aff. ruminicola Tc2-24 TaxID=81582 RepID=A0A1I0NDC8_9BACT|nr:Spi family protease inhibitor [Prevotella aff. ruminicola Tc2-24]SEV99080.1 Peptidase C10 family protein [Prevotella aff. ruminicola Tc2-24]
MKRFFYLVASLFLLYSCSEDQTDMVQNENLADEVTFENSKLSLRQALSYASMFNPGMEKNDSPESLTRSVDPIAKVVSDVDFYIEDGDTLLYAVNYMNDEGYVLIAGDNSSFPILGHSNQGNLQFSDISDESPMAMFISAMKNRVKNNIHNGTSTETDYFDNWKDLGRSGYEYEITVNDNEPQAQTRGRKSSSGKKSIYPYTGKDLDYWCQEGGYNMCAPNRACIGCPAISIGMLMYDTSQRMLGNVTPTYPSFNYTDMRDLKNVTTVTETARKLRQIADSIPNYDWGKKKDAGSGAMPEDILTGLKKLGYKNARLASYDFETVYNNLSFTGINYFGNEATFYRGVLLGAISYDGYGGHIWFCDGYYEQSYTVTKKFLGIKVKSWTEYDDRLYMNWGWGPDGGNGWYLATDNVWSSIEGNPDVRFKYDPKMYINLSTYVW